MYLIKGELTEEIQSRQAIREAEVCRILWNMREVFSPEELEKAAAIIEWLELRDTWHDELPHYRANPGEPVEAFEERIRISQEMADLFPEHRVGACANIWLWLKLGAGSDTRQGKATTSGKDPGI